MEVWSPAATLRRLGKAFQIRRDVYRWAARRAPRSLTAVRRVNQPIRLQTVASNTRTWWTAQDVPSGLGRKGP